jgi:hypothetical protein
MSYTDLIQQQARLRDYRTGLANGMEIAVRLFLGETSNGGEPCPQPIPPEAEAWARDALARIQESKS